MQETILTVQFVLLDSSPLKFAILAHCQEWQNKFTGLLYEIASNRLNELDGYLNNMKNKYVTSSWQTILRQNSVTCHPQVKWYMFSVALYVCLSVCM